MLDMSLIILDLMSKLSQFRTFLKLKMVLNHTSHLRGLNSQSMLRVKPTILVLA